MNDDDGLRGPVGERFHAALRIAGHDLGFAVDPWVDHPWRGRRLTVRPATYGAHGLTTGYRFVVVRLATRHPLGEWADVAMGSHSPLEGTFLPLTSTPPSPRGTWADAPDLSSDLWSWALRMLPEGEDADLLAVAALQVRDDCVLWQLRASRLDAGTLTEAVILLERVATYAETHDAALAARLGQAPGVSRWRRMEKAFVVAMLAVPLVIIGGLLLLDALL